MGAVASILGMGGETSPKRVDSVVGKGGKVVPLQIKRADFAEEGERILNGLTTSFERSLHSALNMLLGDIPPPGDSNKGYHDVDVLWRHPESGGMLYVGNDRAARNDNFLQQIKVTSIVNCTKPSKNGQLDDYHKHTGRYSYYDLPMGQWYDYCWDGLSSDQEKCEACLRFLLPAMAFCLRCLKRGGNVLVHCLAGAHRAGTMGILCLIYMQGHSGADALKIAKALRPVIQPISDFPQLISLFEKALRIKLKGALAPCWSLSLHMGPAGVSLQQAQNAGLTRSNSFSSFSAAAAAAATAASIATTTTDSSLPSSSTGRRGSKDFSGGGGGLERRNSRTGAGMAGMDSTPRFTPRDDPAPPSSARRGSINRGPSFSGLAGPEQQQAAPSQGLSRKPSASRLDGAGGGEAKESGGGGGSKMKSGPQQLQRRRTFGGVDTAAQSTGGDLLLYNDVELDLVAKQMGVKVKPSR